MKPASLDCSVMKCGDNVIMLHLRSNAMKRRAANTKLPAKVCSPHFGFGVFRVTETASPADIDAPASAAASVPAPRHARCINILLLLLDTVPMPRPLAGLGRDSSNESEHGQ